jgi:hypothetical protein
MALRVLPLNFRHTSTPNPTELGSSKAISEMKVDKIVAAEDSRYDSMTEPNATPTTSIPAFEPVSVRDFERTSPWPSRHLTP